jgi:hypothetical protein
MAKTQQDRKSKNRGDRKSKNEEDRQLSKELEMSFPARTHRQRPNLEAASPDPRSRVLKRRSTKSRVNQSFERSSAIDREYDEAPRRSAIRTRRDLRVPRPA